MPPPNDRQTRGITRWNYFKCLIKIMILNLGNLWPVFRRRGGAVLFLLHDFTSPDSPGGTLYLGLKFLAKSSRHRIPLAALLCHVKFLAKSVRP